MATLTIKNIPDGLCHRLRESAKQHRRSINSEVIVCLEQVLGSAPLDPATFLEGVRTLRHSVSRVYVTEEDLRAAKNEARP